MRVRALRPSNRLRALLHWTRSWRERSIHTLVPNLVTTGMKRRRPPSERAGLQPQGAAVVPASRCGDDANRNGRGAAAPLWLGSVVAVVALCGLSYCNTFDNEFSFDDNFAIVNNPDVTEGTTLADLFSHDFWGRDILNPLSHKSWRPLTTLTFRWNFLLTKLGVGSYHAVNLALHTATALALQRFAHRVSDGVGGGGLLGCGTIAACLFAVHPVQ